MINKETGVEFRIDDQTAPCPGGRPLAECQTAQLAVQEAWAAAQARAQKSGESAAGAGGGFSPSGAFWYVPVWAAQVCMECQRECGAQVQIEGGQPTGFVRLEYTSPE